MADAVAVVADVEGAAAAAVTAVADVVGSPLAVVCPAICGAEAGGTVGA